MAFTMEAMAMQREDLILGRVRDWEGLRDVHWNKAPLTSRYLSNPPSRCVAYESPPLALSARLDRSLARSRHLTTPEMAESYCKLRILSLKISLTG